MTPVSQTSTSCKQANADSDNTENYFVKNFYSWKFLWIFSSLWHYVSIIHIIYFFCPTLSNLILQFLSFSLSQPKWHYGYDLLHSYLIGKTVEWSCQTSHTTSKGQVGITECRANQMAGMGGYITSLMVTANIQQNYLHSNSYKFWSISVVLKDNHYTSKKSNMCRYIYSNWAYILYYKARDFMHGQFSK